VFAGGDGVDVSSAPLVTVHTFLPMRAGPALRLLYAWAARVQASLERRVVCGDGKSPESAAATAFACRAAANQGAAEAPPRAALPPCIPLEEARAERALFGVCTRCPSTLTCACFLRCVCCATPCLLHLTPSPAASTRSTCFSPVRTRPMATAALHAPGSKHCAA
jgi:hypothetical protein